MNTTKSIAAALTVTFALASATSAQQQGAGTVAQATHGSGAHTAEPKGDQNASSKAYAAANAKMHHDMNITFTGNSDVDFVKGMIPHHQGAIDMAKVVLAHGKDPAIRKLAEEVIKAQEAEIKMMTEWLAKNEKK